MAVAGLILAGCYELDHDRRVRRSHALRVLLAAQTGEIAITIAAALYH